MHAVLQTESAECGLACIAMLCRHYDDRVSLRELRQRFPLSLKGAALPDLMRIAGRLGFRTRPLRLELEQLPQVRTPAILHWDMNHFVVLVGAGARRLTIIDPAFGKRKLGYGEVSGHFTGVALELTPTNEFRRGKSAPSISVRQLTGRVTGLARALGLILLLSLALQVFVVIGPFFLQWVVDEVLVSADRDLLSALGLGFALVLLLRVGTALLRGWAVVFLSARLGVQWIGNVFSHLLKLPLEFFEKRHLGDVVSRIGSVRSIQQALTTSFVEALIDGLMATVTLTMMILYSTRLAFISVTAVFLYLVLRALLFRPLREGTEQQLVAGAKQQSHLLESIRGIQSIKLAGVEQQREAAYANFMNDTVNREVRLSKLNLGFNGASGLIFGIERIAVIWTGALLVLENAFSVGMLIAYLAYKDQFSARIGALIDQWIELRMLRLHGERLADIVLTPPDEQVPRPGGAFMPSSARIEVRGLSFRYGDGEPWILENLSLSIASGEAVAIVGSSGCGKTTLIKLLLGLLRPVSGSILVDGQDIRKIGLSSYRQFVGAVMQDDQLFAGSIADNVAFGHDGYDPARVEAAARLAGVHDEIAAMPMRYQSLVGDMGSTLSGGQKQRVILARALYRRPKLLFLDEATSHLDVRRERAVVDAIRRLTLTRVIIAHRAATVATADRVLLLRNGRIAPVARAGPTPDPRAVADAPAGAAA